MIASTIANKLNIDIDGDIKAENLSKIRKYFLQEYVSCGYVIHAIPNAYYDSIVKNGLIVSLSDRTEKPKDVQQIQYLFMDKGIVSLMGSYLYYGDCVIYYEPNFTRVFQHAIDSLERFGWFAPLVILLLIIRIFKQHPIF